MNRPLTKIPGRVTVEPLTPEHFGRVAEWLCIPEVHQFLTSVWRSDTVSASMVAIAARSRTNRFYLTRFEGRPVGMVALSDCDIEDQTAMAWYLLGESELGGKGITSEAVRLVCRIGFGTLGLASVYAWAMEPNIASQKVLQHIGFQHAGRLRRAARFDGRSVDRIYFDLLRPAEFGAVPVSKEAVA